jgi:micrococcal nuclease
MVNYLTNSKWLRAESYLMQRSIRVALLIAFCLALAYFGGQDALRPPANGPARERPTQQERTNVQNRQTPATISGKVVAIADGDTIQLRADQQITVRMEGIDAPERGQPFGDQSRRHLSELTFGKAATVEVVGKDQFDRTLGIVRVDGEDINNAMVRDGFAWRYLHSDSQELARLESEARKEKRGLWRDREPTPPWVWRRENPRDSQ